MDALAHSGLRYEVLIDDVQAEIDAERARLSARPDGTGAWFDDFKDLAALDARVLELAALRPDLARAVVVGSSLEGRPIRALRITHAPPDRDPRKPALVFVSTQHAREWIAPMATMYLAEALITRYDTDPVIRDVVDRTEVILVPVANPDGYVYSWTTDRLWRKNRRVVAGSGCRGVDLNRNWGYQWGLPVGSSGDPCNEVYRGTAGFSEPETAALRDFIESTPDVRYVHDMHSYGQWLLYPWGYTSAPPPNQADYADLGAAMSSLIQSVHGRVYTPGSTYTTLYPVSGGSNDWALGARNAFTFTYELRGPSFVLPPAEIVPNSEEILPAVLYLADWMADTWVPARRTPVDATVGIRSLR
jgi:murein tripeptide amidase MpaA